MEKLLSLITTVEVAGAVSFVAAEKFIEGKTIDGVSFARFGDNFKQNFLCKTETDVAPATLRIQKLGENSRDTPILAGLGSTAEITLTHFFGFLKTADRTKWFICYVIAASAKRNLWAVYAHCFAVGGWEIGAGSIGGPCKWSAVLQVVSR